MKKRGLSIILAIAMLMLFTSGMTSYADSVLTEEKACTVVLQEQETATLTFTPQHTGIYFIESDCDDADPIGEIWLDDECYGNNDDVWMHPENTDFNFCLTVILEQGVTYTVNVYEASGKAATFDVRATFKDAVSDVVFTPVDTYSYIENAGWERFDFNNGDKLTVKTKDTSYVFVYNEEDGQFMDGDGDSINDSFSDAPTIARLYDEENDEFLGKAEIQFFHYTFTADTVALPNPVKSISYQLKTPLVLVKNTGGAYDYDDDEKEYYLYDVEIGNNGDVLTVNYTDGRTVQYTCRVESEETDEGVTNFYSYVDKNGNEIDYDFFGCDAETTQYWKHWTVGTNTFTVTYMGKECTVPVKVINTGWQKTDGKWYYYNNSGVAVTGWLKDGAWYYMNSNGVMQTGWQYVGGRWYLLASSGAMLTGWQYVGGVWYYLSGSGAMVTGWQYIGGKWYYFNGSGAMLTGWQYVGGVWYYFNGSGAMVTGWQYIGGKWYYFNSSGSMRTASLRQGSKTYYFNSSGACTNP